MNRRLADRPIAPEKPVFRGLSRELVIQPKLMIGAADDQYEQEADRVAQQVVQRLQAPDADTAPPDHAQQHNTEKADDTLQRKTNEVQGEAIGGGEATPDLAAAIQRSRGSGQPLDEGLQERMGQAMGADFSGVRVHTDSEANQLNRSIQARAFTTGQDIFFRQGHYNPDSRYGQALIAHELTHVMQQGRGTLTQSKSRPNTGIIQLKPMKKNALNVVGENHVESDQRRKLEKAFVAEATDDITYWNENEFAEGTVKRGWQKQGNGEGNEGDRPELQALHAVVFADKYIQNLWKKAIALMRVLTKTVEPSKLDVKPSKLFEQMTQAIAENRENIDRNFRFLKPTTNIEINNIVKALAKDVRSVIDKDVYAEIDVNTIDEKTLGKCLLKVAKLSEKSGEASLKLHKLTGVPPLGKDDDVPVNDEPVAKARSHFMGIAAGFAASRGVTGTWKIGEAHLQHLLSSKTRYWNDAANYVTKQEFNQDYEIWKLEMQLRQLIKRRLELESPQHGGGKTAVDGLLSIYGMLVRNWKQYTPGLKSRWTKWEKLASQVVATVPKNHETPN